MFDCMSEPSERTGSATVTTSSTRVAGATAREPAWRCLELAASRPTRVVLTWRNRHNAEAQVRFDLTRSQRVYIYAAWFELTAETYASTATLSWHYTEVPGPPAVQSLRLHESLAAGSYDSDTDGELVPPQWACRLKVERGTLSGGSFDLVLYRGSSALAEHDESTMPSEGVELAGATRITLTATGTRVRLTYLLEL